jgi:FtsH-binding integral membrane protein
VSAAFDAGWLLVFVLIGRTSHTEGLTVPGVLRTVWPFWVGLLIGWMVSRAWRAPAALIPTGVVVWPACVAAAMALRALSGQGVAAAFIGVALAFVGLGLLGWRALAHLVPIGQANHGDQGLEAPGLEPPDRRI